MTFTLRAVVDGEISFAAKECHPKVIEQLAAALSFANPEYVGRMRMGRSVDGVAPMVTSMRQDGAGRVHLPRGTVALLLAYVGDVGGEVVFEDRRVVADASLTWALRVPLRPYQQRAVTIMRQGVQGTLLAPCGAGKTQVGVAVICAVAQPALVLVHTHDLAVQWRERIALCLGQVSGLIGGGQMDIQPITVATVQSLVRLAPPALADLGRQFGCVLVDECHHVPASTFQQVLAYLPAKYRYGLTATPDRSDGLGLLLDYCIGPCLYTIAQDELVRLGYLHKPQVQYLYTSFSYEYDDASDHHALMQALTTDSARNQLIVERVVADARAGCTVLVLTGRVAHCQHLAELIMQQGVRCGSLTGTVGKAERHALLNAFRDGSLPVLVASTVADEGLDVPRLDRIVLAYPTRAKGRTTQRLGRLARPYPGKEAPVLYDVVDLAVPPLLRQWRERKKLYRDIGADVGAAA